MCTVHTQTSAWLGTFHCMIMSKIRYVYAKFVYCTRNYTNNKNIIMLCSSITFSRRKTSFNLYTTCNNDWDQESIHFTKNPPVGRCRPKGCSIKYNMELRMRAMLWSLVCLALLDWQRVDMYTTFTAGYNKYQVRLHFNFIPLHLVLLWL